tara:strand:- start:962 stop:1504 length:543 start_codon:yes stop_codon:yes gene_type:complete
MATFIMIPNGTALSVWDASGGGTAAYTDVDNDNGDTEYAYSNTTGERIIVDLEAPSVASGDVDTINSVTIKASAKKVLFGTSYMHFTQTGTSADSSAISNGYDIISVPSSASYATYSGTAETTSDGSDAWVYGDLAGLQIRIDKHRNDRFGELRVSYLYAEVDYTVAVAQDNSTFFGTNF